jgi:hypothetical protein
MGALMAAAKQHRVQLDEIGVQAPSGIETAIRRAKELGAQAVYVWTSGFAYAFAKQISDVVHANGLPSIHPFREGVVSGCLLAYAADLQEEARRGAGYVDRSSEVLSPETFL